LLSKVTYFLNDIDNKKYFELLGKPYDIKCENIKTIYVLFYHELLKYIGERLPAELFFKLVDEDYWSNIRILYKKHEDEFLKREKERLLSGNMKVERQFKIDKYSFENINTAESPHVKNRQFNYIYYQKDY